MGGEAKVIPRTNSLFRIVFLAFEALTSAFPTSNLIIPLNL